MRVDRTTGPLLASLLAGPIATSPLLLAFLPPRRDPIGMDVLAIVLLLLFSTIFGFVISLLPNFIGSGLMYAAGRRFAVARHRLAWAIVGAALGYLMGAAFTGFSAWMTGVWLAPAGLLCALICRHFAIWPEGAGAVLRP